MQSFARALIGQGFARTHHRATAMLIGSTRTLVGSVGRLSVRTVNGTRPIQTSVGLQAGAASSEQVLLHCDWMNRQLWYDKLQSAGVPVTWAGEIRDWAAVRYAVGWNFTPELLSQMPGLRAIASLGAGVDHAMRPGLIPPGVDIVRIVDPLMAQRMATWVMWAVINFQRKMDVYAKAQRERRWDKKIESLKPWDNHQVRVGILGFGVMGQATARLLAAAGYDVAAWARRPRSQQRKPTTTDAAAAATGASARDVVADVPVYAGGREELRRFVERVDVLVCLLPLTPETQGFINQELLSWLPPRSAVVNAARGKHMDEEALIRALDSGRVGAAILDVFSAEPLPATSPLWTHPNVRITPHVSSITDVPNAAAQIADNYRRLVSGLPLLHVADQAAGY